jgi:hypothetical protein
MDKRKKDDELNWKIEPPEDTPQCAAAVSS